MAGTSTPRDRFRQLLIQPGCSSPASVHDPISARIAEHLEFELGIFAGSVASLAVLGSPDLILLTLTEFAEQARRITRAGSLPLLVDADHGYGNALNVMRCVNELETAGVSALSIEDTELPAAAGAGGKPRLTSVEEGVGKMRAALQARTDPSLVIAGRTSAAAISNSQDAALRVKAYEEAGVDALFLVGVKTVPDLELISAATTLPLILGSAGAEVTQPEVLNANRVKICLRGHQPFAAATQAIYETMRLLKAGTPGSELPNLASAELMKSLSKHEQFQQWSRQFLDAE
ncbi:MAG: isocitrate lyase/PEP mutase family protein [Burkholderiaceae bacterium]